MTAEKNRRFSFLLLAGLIAILTGCSSRTADSYLKLQSLGPAPELENDVWINTDHPLRLADLQGKVVLLDMWTYG